MATISVDVDIEDFDTDDLVIELVSRKDFSDRDLKRLKDFVKGEIIEDAMGFIPTNIIDEMKVKVVKENIHKKSLQELEAFFNQ